MDNRTTELIRVPRDVAAELRRRAAAAQTTIPVETRKAVFGAPQSPVKPTRAPVAGPEPEPEERLRYDRFEDAP